MAHQFVQAIETNNREMADKLVADGLDLNAPLPRSFWAIPGFLHYFVERSQPDAIERLIDWYPQINCHQVWDYYYVRNEKAVQVFSLLIQRAGRPDLDKLKKIHQETLTLLDQEIVVRSSRTRRKHSVLQEFVKTVEQYLVQPDPREILSTWTADQLAEKARQLGFTGSYKRSELINLLTQRETGESSHRLTEDQLDQIGQWAHLTLRGTAHQKAHQLADYFKQMY